MVGHPMSDSTKDFDTPSFIFDLVCLVCPTPPEKSPMRTAIVPASDLSSKDLRASAYVANPKEIAYETVRTWRDEFPVLDMTSKGGKRLVELVEQAIRESLEKQ